MSEHQPLPWSVNQYGELLDATGDKVRICGVSLPCGYVPRDDAGHSNRDLIVRSVTELSEEARRQVIAAAEARGAARAVEQCRRLAEEAADRHDENADRYGGEGSRSDDWPLSKNEEMKGAALRDFATSLAGGPPSVVSIDLVRRLAKEYAIALEANGQHYAAISLRELLRRIETAGPALRGQRHAQGRRGVPVPG